MVRFSVATPASGMPMTTRKPPRENWEAFTERQIQQAQQEGAFDHLQGAGSPMPDIGELHEQDWWLKRKLQSESLSCLPPSLAIRLDVAKTMERICSLRDEAKVRSQLESLNQRILQANLASVSGPPSSTMRLDIDETIQSWKRQLKTPGILRRS